MKHGDTLRTAIKYGTVALLSFAVGRLSALLATWPHTPAWMDVDATGVVVNGVVATGTCAAVIAALYIASSDNRRKNREAMIEARITAATVTFRVGTAIAAIRTVKDAAEKALKDDILPKAIPSIAAPLESISRFSSDELLSLMPLPNYCAENIAAGYDRIFIATMFLKKEAEKHASNRSSREQCFQMVRKSLAEAHEMLTRAGKTLEESTVEFRKTFDDVNFE
ncbi:hypothetical protein [Burkholderia territorii]|uniref:hypothetical protein n=1 Tax=Burkholderia territorii TaxID=1503055 RepID=UPI00075EE73E|nr:hypothetical protein [Burkholderia territorii]KWA22044.1 hypothetical protein WT38_17330 [Burkholderia territorii]